MVPDNYNHGLRIADSAPLIYFYHIPKTAGTSLHFALRDEYGVDGVTPQMLWDDLISDQREIPSSVRVVVGHFGGILPFYLGYMPRMVTILRDPVARALSHINHVQRDVNHPLHELGCGLSITEYCRHPELRQTIDNVQTRYLASFCFAEALMTPPRQLYNHRDGHYSVAFENALLAMDSWNGLADAAIRTMTRMECFGLCEEFDRTLDHFADVLDWKSRIKPVVVNVAGPKQKKVDDLGFRERRELQALNKFDLDLYDWAVSIFSARCGVSVPKAKFLPIRMAA